MFGNSWYKKESPLQALLGMGGGVVSSLIGGGASNNIEASGGTTTTYSSSGVDYKTHTFLSSGTFVVTNAPGDSDYDISYLITAGGGGTPPGTDMREGGSGAGGLIYGPSSVEEATYPITIGGGGSNGEGSNSSVNWGSQTRGAGPQTAIGGGSGGHNDGNPGCQGRPGGSGGGGWYVDPGQGGEGTQTASPGGNATGQGNDGRQGFNTPEYGGSGGGAGGPGDRGNSPGSGTVSSYRYGPTNNQTYSAGGAACNFPGVNRRAAGGANTGNGSSGHAAGGSGICIIRYRTN